MLHRILSFWRDESGEITAGWAVMATLVGLASIVWFNQIGGQGGVDEGVGAAQTLLRGASSWLP